MLLRVLIVWNWTRVTLALWNVARWKPTYQISDYSLDGIYLYSRLAVDGLKNTSPSQPPYCAHTDEHDQAWWLVDLQGRYVVKRIMMTNRTGCCQDRLRRFRIEFFNTDPRLLPHFPNVRGSTCYRHGTSILGGGDLYFDCAEGTEGRFGMVVFEAGYKEKLTLCGFEALVESVLSRNILYNTINDTRATDHSLLTLNVPDHISCATECNMRRDQELCTAFNWKEDRQECRLLSIDPYNPANSLTDVGWRLYRITMD